jgi:hypothetical protein
MTKRVLYNIFIIYYISIDHWLHEYPKDQRSAVIARLTRWLKMYDGVHTLLSDRSEIGWYGVAERESKHSAGIPFACEYTPEHVHHNWRFNTEAYKKSKESRGLEAASPGQFSKTTSNSKYW